MSWKRKIFFSLLMMSLILLAVELILHLVANNRPVKPFFVRSAGGSVSFHRNSSFQSVFRDPKPDGTFRVFVFGESAAAGVIYDPQSTFPKLLQEMLQYLSLGKKIEVVNCAIIADNSDGVLEAYRAALSYEPDLMVIYCGNNEFFRFERYGLNFHPWIYRLKKFLLAHSRIYSMVQGFAVSSVDLNIALIGNKIGRQYKPIFDADLKARITSGFSRNLYRMVASGQEHQVEVILAVPVVNLADWPPQKSICEESQEECNAREKLLREAERALYMGHRERGEALLRPVMVQDPDNAMAEFLSGRLAMATGELTKARSYFQAAVENDDSLVPRAKPSQQQVIRQLARSLRVPLVDIQAIFDQHSPGGITGFNLIDDHCHHTLDGQALVAAALAEAISWLHPNLFRYEDQEEMFSRRNDFLTQLSIGPNFLATNLQVMAFYLAFRFDDPGMSEQALRLLRQQSEIVRGTTIPFLVEGMIRLRQAADDPARAAFERALRENPDHSARMIDLYFKRFLRWQPPYLLVQARPGTSFNPILNDYLARKKSPIPLGLNHADRVYLLSGNTLIDISAPVLKRVADRERRTPPAPLALFPTAENGGPRLSLANLNREGDRFTATGPDPRLSFSLLDLDPTGYAALEVKLEVEGPSAPRQRLCLYWRSSQPNFREQDKACAEPDLAGGAGVYLVPLADDPDWVMAGTVRGLRLDPGENAVSFRRLGIRLVPFFPPPEENP